MNRCYYDVDELAIQLALNRLGVSDMEITKIFSSELMDKNPSLITQACMKKYLNIKKHCCNCNYNLNHKACIIIYTNKCMQILCDGQNQSYIDGSSEHAEINCIKHLPPRKNWNRQLLIVDMMVIRVSKTGLLGNSAPCIHCLRSITHLPHKMGYHINRIYYTNPDGKIESYKLDDLIAIDPHLTSFHRRNKKNNNIKNIFKWRESYLERIKNSKN